MGFSFGGLLFKNGSSVHDDTLQDLLGTDGRIMETTTMEEAISSQFTGIGVARTDDDLLIVISLDIPYASSFEEDEKMTETDHALAALSEKGDIAVLLSYSPSDTYTWSIFSKGQRVRVSKTTGGKLVYESGKPTEYERNMDNRSNRMIRLIENFTGYDYSELVFDLGLEVEVYNP